MKYFNYMLVTMVVALVSASTVAEPIIYPSQGQDAEHGEASDVLHGGNHTTCAADRFAPPPHRSA